MSPLQGTAFSIPPNARSQVARSLSGCTKLLGLWWVYQSALFGNPAQSGFLPMLSRGSGVHRRRFQGVVELRRSV